MTSKMTMDFKQKGTKFILFHFYSSKKCICNSGWKNSDCSLEICPDQCGNLTGKGFCSLELQRCICRSGYSGIDCSLDENNFIGKKIYFYYICFSQNL